MLVRAGLTIAILVSAHQAQASEAKAESLCRGDALRLCMSEIPDRERITACMNRQKALLSPGCRSVFNAPKGPNTTKTAGR